jgi:hypothetical protein
VHPQEALLQQARAFQASEAFAEVRRRRQAAEHRLARLVHLGLRQARYVGHAKTLFQLALAATVANLTLLAYADATGHDRAALTALAVAGAATLLWLRLFAPSPPLAPLVPRSRRACWRCPAPPLPALAFVASRARPTSRPDF